MYLLYLKERRVAPFSYGREESFKTIDLHGNFNCSRKIIYAWRLASDECPVYRGVGKRDFGIGDTNYLDSVAVSAERLAKCF